MKLILLSLIVGTLSLFGAEQKPLLIVLTNHADLGDTGKPTGFFLSEAAHPYEVFTKAGYEVTLASPKGGFAPVDPKSLKDKDEASQAFWEKFGAEETDHP
ncbi:MAG: hypothetical protein ACQKBU_07320, partial [Verrucomicrobiales bacterium]